MLAEVKTGAPKLKLNGDDVAPPKPGLKTVMFAAPAVAMSAAVICAVSCVELTYVVVRKEPFHCTMESTSNPLPVTVKVNAFAPDVAELGENDVIEGASASKRKISCVTPLPSDAVT